jgi:5-methyltetrahydropteroyltriglutamate--homocysteine methyltransferase
MKRSIDRILTTHAGSLPRPGDLRALVERDGARALDAPANAAQLRSAVADIVRKQAELGIDVVDDGEYGKPSFVSYINERLGGYELDPAAGPRNQWATSREGLSFPEFYAQTHAAARHPHMVCTGPITYKGHVALKRDIDNFKTALARVKVEEAFMPAISPSNIEDWQRNAYYKSQEQYVFAIADAMHQEYRAIVNAGLLLQIDDPRLVTYYIIHPEASIADCRRWAEIRVEALNHALRGHPAGKGPLSHLLRHQYGAAHSRYGAERHR